MKIIILKKMEQIKKHLIIYKIFIQCKRKCNSFSFKYIHKLMEHKILMKILKKKKRYLTNIKN